MSQGNKEIERAVEADAFGELKALDMVPTPSQYEAWRQTHVRYTSLNASEDVSIALSTSSAGGLGHPS